jgi:SAM-dependent methyltransferase
MDVRATENPWLLRAERWLERVNQRHPWNHDEHFHGWILRNLPEHRGTALDVGCGTGVLLERLSSRFSQVTGIDVDPGMAEAARRRISTSAGATVQLSGFPDFAAQTDDAAFDLITLVASLHHLDLVSAVLNPLVGLIKHPRAVPDGSSPAQAGPIMPIKDVAMTAPKVAAATRAALPGCSFRRRLFFRYTFRWDKPGR